MKLLPKFVLTFIIFLGVACLFIYGQSSPPLIKPSSIPNLPMNIPPPPSFGSMSSKNGKYQLVSAEYYSEDTKPFLYKRLIKFDTTTGEAWVLSSKIGTNSEERKWVPLETKKTFSR